MSPLRDKLCGAELDILLKKPTAHSFLFKETGQKRLTLWLLVVFQTASLSTVPERVEEQEERAERTQEHGGCCFRTTASRSQEPNQQLKRKRKMSGSIFIPTAIKQLN